MVGECLGFGRVLWFIDGGPSAWDARSSTVSEIACTVVVLNEADEIGRQAFELVHW